MSLETLRVLGHIHTFNDGDVIDRSLQGLLAQTYPLDEILLVDNASTDSTLQRPFPKKVTIVRHPENRGTSGAVVTGFRYALAKQYDWIWVFDADSVPFKDALERLVELYQSLSRNLQEQVWRLSSLPMDVPTWGIISPAALISSTACGVRDLEPRHGIIFTPRGYARVEPDSKEAVYCCHASIWTGSLFKLDKVQKIGMPSVDYVLDYGEYAYAYHAMRCGYRMFMHQLSIVMHNITGSAALCFSTYKLGPLSFSVIELPPIRCYYVTRNTIYFWLYVYHIRNIYTVLPRLYKIVMLTMNFLLRPRSRRAELYACFRGIWDGLRKNLDRRY